MRAMAKICPEQVCARCTRDICTTVGTATQANFSRAITKREQAPSWASKMGQNGRESSPQDVRQPSQPTLSRRALEQPCCVMDASGMGFAFAVNSDLWVAK